MLSINSRRVPYPIYCYCSLCPDLITHTYGFDSNSVIKEEFTFAL